MCPEETGVKVCNCLLPQRLIHNLNTEAETIQSLAQAVTSDASQPDKTSVQSAWLAEKKALLEAIQALKNLVAQTRQTALVRILHLISRTLH